MTKARARRASRRIVSRLGEGRAQQKGRSMGRNIRGSKRNERKQNGKADYCISCVAFGMHRRVASPSELIHTSALRIHFFFVCQQAAHVRAVSLLFRRWSCTFSSLLPLCRDSLSFLQSAKPEFCRERVLRRDGSSRFSTGTSPFPVHLSFAACRALQASLHGTSFRSLFQSFELFFRLSPAVPALRQPVHRVLFHSS